MNPFRSAQPAGTAPAARAVRWPQVALIVAVVFLAVAGVALLATYFVMSSQPAGVPSWIGPHDALQETAVAPDIAVLTLAGEPDDRIIRASLDAGERETASATLAYSVLLPDPIRSGQWLILASAYRDDDPTRAATAYHAAADLAALGPTLGDPARAEISLQAARGFGGLDRTGLAPLLIAQAENIARFSPTLLPGQRRDLLNQVAAAYERLNQVETARKIRDNIAAYSAGPGVPTERPEPLLATLRGAVTLPADVITAMSARQQAAAALAARWLSADPAERETLAAALGETLEQEDAARTSFYATAGSLSEADRLALLHDRINWLTIKLRVARGAFGTSLVPTWEGQAEDGIRAELAAGYIELINGYGRQLDTLDPVEALNARVELLRQGVLWVRLGLFPDGDAEEALARQLSEASADLWSRGGGAGLTIVNQVEQGMRMYLLAGSDTRE